MQSSLSLNPSGAQPFIFHNEPNELWQNRGSCIMRRALDPATKQLDDQHLVIAYSTSQPDDPDIVYTRIGYFEKFERGEQVWQGWMKQGSYSTASNQWIKGGDEATAMLQQPNVTLRQKKLSDIDKSVFLSSLSQVIRNGQWDYNKFVFPTESQIDPIFSEYCLDAKLQVQEGNWFPDPNKVKDIVEKFMNKFEFEQGRVKFQNKNELNEFYVKAARVILFLQNEDAVFYQLKKLNKLLEGVIIHKRSLRNVLENQLKPLGFQAAMGKATDLLTEKEFLDTVREGIHLKDLGAGDSHGVFTHAMQWLLMGWQQQNTNFLGENVKASDFYRQIGGAKISEEYLTSLSPSIFWLSEMWVHMVDQVRGESTKEFDATCPEKLNAYIMKRKNVLPFLAEAILAPGIARLSKHEKLAEERQEIIKLYGEDGHLGIWNEKRKIMKEEKDKNRYEKKGRNLYHPKK